MKSRKEKGARLLSWLRNINIYWLVIIPIVFALILLSVLTYIGEKMFNGVLPEFYFNLCVIIFLLVISLSGFAQVIRKEGPGPFGDSSYGIWSVVSGYIIIGLTWAAIIYLLIISI